MIKEPRTCAMDGKPLPPGRVRFCSTRCANRANQVKRYGLSPEDYRSLTQTGRCAICNRVVRRWNIDHDHKTHLVRGAVCGTCNQRVLTALHTIEQAEGLLEYFRNPPASRLPGEPRMVGTLITNRKKGYFK